MFFVLNFFISLMCVWLGKSTVLVICVHKQFKSIVFTVSIQFCENRFSDFKQNIYTYLHLSKIVILPRNNPCTAGLWSSEIENYVCRGKRTDQLVLHVLNHSQKKRNTSHRLLTNSEVINEKREVAKRKEEKK